MKYCFTPTTINTFLVYLSCALANIMAMSCSSDILARISPNCSCDNIDYQLGLELTCKRMLTFFPNETYMLHLIEVQDVATLNSTTFNETSLQNMRKMVGLQVLHGNTAAFSCKLKYLTKFYILRTIEANTFTGLSGLKILHIKHAPNLEQISPLALQGLTNVAEILIQYTGILQINGFGKLLPPVQIYVKDNPRLSIVNSNAFSGLFHYNSDDDASSNVEYVFNTVIAITNNSNLQKIQEYAFSGSKITLLDLSENRKLSVIDQTAFKGSEIRNLSLSSTHITSLPTDGLEDLINLKLTNVYSLHIFPSSKQLPRLEEANLTYPYHCCALLNNYGFQVYFEPETVETKPCVSDGEKYIPHNDSYDEYIYEYDEGYGIPLDSANANLTVSLCYHHENGSLLPHFTHKQVKSQLRCWPADNEFSPCENLLGHRVVSALSWLVGCLAVFGNLLVILVFAIVAFDRKRTQKRDLSVPKFLILNLAIGDFFMGLYVVSLSVMDAKMDNHSYVYAIEWQYGGGCNFAGFIAIFSSQLSLFTLGVISLERWYAIRNAIKLDKRMSLRFAMGIMLCGWTISVLLAILPLVGVNGYQNNILCLPMTLTNLGLSYIAFIVAMDMCTFIVVIGCYIWMYSLVRTTSSHERMFVDLFKRQRSVEETKHRDMRTDADARVAKRMAVLVFTDFACTFPICFFALFQLAGFQLLSISTSKILLVICFPFNSCLNPFLYAILTKSFRQDVHSFIRSQRHHLAGKGCKVSIRRMEKRSNNSGRQEERRNTMKCYVENSGDAASSPSPQTSANCVSSIKTTKTRNIINNNNNTQKSNSADMSSKPPLRAASSQSSITKRLAMFAILRRFNFNIFRSKNKESVPVSVVFSKHTIETHISGHSTADMPNSAKKDSLSIEAERTSVPEQPTPDTEVHYNSETFEDIDS